MNLFSLLYTFALLCSNIESLSIHQFPILNLPYIEQNMKTSPPHENSLMLSDVIAKFRNVNAFISFTRNFESITQIFGNSSVHTTILAPINSAIMELSLKPWEDSNEYDMFGAEAYEGHTGEVMAVQNLRKFVETHILPISPWNEGTKAKTLSGKEFWWHNKNGKRIIQPGDLEVAEVLSSMHNGELWMIRGTMK